MNRVCSIFAQLLQFIPRLEFAAAVAEHQSERHARGFSSWTQFVAMLFCQLGHAQSLREITRRHSSFADLTQRSEKAFKFGLRGGNVRHFAPSDSRIDRKVEQNLVSRSWRM